MAYPNYYNVPSWQPVQIGQAGFSPYAQQSFTMPTSNTQYMYQVDGEIGAHAWQAPGNVPLGPNAIVPLFDFDGVHIYLKTTDAYGRMNPMRKGRVVFDDEQQNLPQQSASNVQSGQMNQNPQLQKNGNVSGAQSIELPDMSKFVTKDDFESFKEDLRAMFSAQASRQQSGSNQNGNKGGRN